MLISMFEQARKVILHLIIMKILKNFFSLFTRYCSTIETTKSGQCEIPIFRSNTPIQMPIRVLPEDLCQKDISGN